MDARFRPEFFRRALRRRWPTVLVALVIGLLAGNVLVATATVEYRATSVVFLDPLVGNPYSPTTPTTRQEQLAALTTEAGLVLTDGVVREAERLAEEEDADLGAQVQERTTTEVPSNSQVVHVSFTARTPQEAQVGAQALAEAYLDYRQSRSESVVKQQVARVDEEIASLASLLGTASSELDAAVPDDPTTTVVSAEVLNLQEQVRIYANQLGQLSIERSAAESASMSPGEIVSPARLPSSPEGFPAPLIAAAIVLVALGAGVVLALVRENLDTRLWTAEDVDALGVGPIVGPMSPWRPEIRGTDAEDAYRLAMNSLHRDGTARPVALLGTAGAAPHAVAAGLAHVVSDTGRSVTVVVAAPSDADDADRPGLSDALQDGGAQNAASLLSEVHPGVWLMGAGRQTGELPTLVQRPGFAELITALATWSDLLIIVGPDARTATGAAIARTTGAAFLVVTVARTDRAALLDSARLLEESDARIQGVLVADRSGENRRLWRGRAEDRRSVEDLLAQDADASGSDIPPSTATPGGEGRGGAARERQRTGSGA